MLDRPRSHPLGWALFNLVLFGVLAAAVHGQWHPVVVVDRAAQSWAGWAQGQDWLLAELRFVEILFGTYGMLIIALLIGGWLWVRRHRRAGIYATAMIVLTWLVTQGVKRLFDRPRPPWQWHEHVHRLPTSFPSGHASAVTALAIVMVVLAMMLVRKASMRRLVYGAAGLLVALIWADRLLLGRHYPSDVLGGSLLALIVCLLGLAFYSPLPRSHARKAEPLPQVYGSDSRRLAVVLNPVKVESVDAFRATVTSMAAEAGWGAPHWYFTTVEDPGAGMAEHAAADGSDLVLVCGGDGTVREVCAELAGTGIPVGIIPAGTGNLLARNLDIPLFLRAAIDVALTGQDRAIDLVTVSGDGLDDTHFMVMAGMGFDAAIMEGVNEEFKAKVGWIAYFASAFKSLMFPAARIDISIDGGEFTRHRARTVVVGNVGYLQAGLPLLPDAAIDDGVLDVVIVHPRKFLSWLPVVFRVLAKSQRSDETLQRLTGQQVTIRAHADTPRQLDGDAIGPGRELRMECIHGRLLVRVPR